ncbi:MAG TPA: right-handed parallel beta-helix repeat-containing protein [Candidatus Bathyarchaeia archaeon]|nr:right-handed parallel beta-helix repeat-containing protein [Candidatus Bathyarchaeia archaeon]
MIITVPGSYILVENITADVSDSFFFNIQTNNVVLDLGGHTINGNGIISQMIIASNVTNITIQNGTIINGINNGVFFNEDTTIALKNITINNTINGSSIFIENSAQGIFENVTIGNTENGNDISLDNDIDFTFDNTTTYQNLSNNASISVTNSQNMSFNSTTVDNSTGGGFNLFNDANIEITGATISIAPNETSNGPGFTIDTSVTINISESISLRNKIGYTIKNSFDITLEADISQDAEENGFDDDEDSFEIVYIDVVSISSGENGFDSSGSEIIYDEAVADDNGGFGITINGPNITVKNSVFSNNETGGIEITVNGNNIQLTDATSSGNTNNNNIVNEGSNVSIASTEDINIKIGIDNIIRLNEFPATVTEPGTYTIEASVTAESPEPMITIEGSNITLDLEGRILNGNDTASNGIKITNSFNVTIKNGSIQNTTESNITIENSDDTTVKNMNNDGCTSGSGLFGFIFDTIFGGGCGDEPGLGLEDAFDGLLEGCGSLAEEGIPSEASGFSFEGCGDIIVNNCYAFQMLTGYEVTNSSNITFKNCISFDAIENGYEVPSGEDVDFINCIAQGSGLDGFLTTAQAILYQGCIATGNGENGFETGGIDVVYDYCPSSFNNIGFEITPAAINTSLIGVIPEDNTTADIDDNGTNTTIVTLELIYDKIPGPDFVITEVPYIITKPGTYGVAKQFTATTPDIMITIDGADNVTLDLTGHTLNGGGMAPSGLSITGGSTNITVQNGAIQNTTGPSITFDNSKHITIKNIQNDGCTSSGGGIFGLILDTIFGSGCGDEPAFGLDDIVDGLLSDCFALPEEGVPSLATGFELEGCTDMLLEGCGAYQMLTGFSTTGCTGVTLQGCKALDCIDDGFDYLAGAGDEYQCIDCMSQSAGGIGFSNAGPNGYYQNCTASRSGGDGFLTSIPDTIFENCIAILNDGNGFDILGGATGVQIIGGSAQGNTGEDINNVPLAQTHIVSLRNLDVKTGLQTVIEIDQLPYTITIPGTYVLAGSTTITSAVPAVITISTDGVILDLNGATLDAPNANSIIDIPGVSNVIVRNGILQGSTTSAIDVDGSDDVTVEDVAIQNAAGVPLAITTASRPTLSNIQVSNVPPGQGSTLTDVDDGIVKGYEAYNADGLVLNGCSNMIFDTIQGTGPEALSFTSTFISATDCENMAMKGIEGFDYNTFIDFDGNTGCDVADVTATGPAGSLTSSFITVADSEDINLRGCVGFDFSRTFDFPSAESNINVEDCIATGTPSPGGFGYRVTDSAVITFTRCTANQTVTGFLVIGSSPLFYECIATNNTTGFFFDAASDPFSFQCVSTFNTTDIVNNTGLMNTAISKSTEIVQDFVCELVNATQIVLNYEVSLSQCLTDIGNCLKVIFPVLCEVGPGAITHCNNLANVGIAQCT